MGRRLLRLLIERGLLLALPFAAWFVWREVARRTGRPMGSTPWAWLFAAGALLVGLSLMATAVFHIDNRDQTYIPAVTHPDGQVTPGRFEQKASPRP
jgi:hypothetical protein